MCYVVTSLDTMSPKDKEEYEQLLNNSTKLIDLLLQLEVDDEDKKLILNVKYASVLFGFKSSTIDYHNLSEICGKQYYVGDISKFELQKLIKDYLGNIDSTLDYLEKFVSYLGNKRIVFEREANDFCNRINYQRNQVLHEKVPAICFNEYFGQEEDVTVCHQFTGNTGSKESYVEIEIIFNEDLKNGKKYTLQRFLESTYYPTKNKIEEIIEGIIEELC